MDFTKGDLSKSKLIKLDLSIGEPMQNFIHRKDNSPKTVNHRWTLKDQRSNLTTSEDFQLMIFYKLVSHCKPLGSIISKL